MDASHTVITVDHDVHLIAGADRVIEMGPGSGAEGGQVVADGAPGDVAQGETPTGRVLAGAPAR